MVGVSKKWAGRGQVGVVLSRSGRSPPSLVAACLGAGREGKVGVEVCDREPWSGMLTQNCSERRLAEGLCVPGLVANRNTCG